MDDPAAGIPSETAPIDDFHAYKAIKEAFVSNLSGTTQAEVAAVVFMLPANLCLHFVLSRLLGSANSGWLAYAVEFVALIAPCVLFVTVLSDYVFYYDFLAVSLAFVVNHWTAPPSDSSFLEHERKFIDNLVSKRKHFVSIFKASVMFLTCIAILAVDFKAFPRRFAKTENFGTSVMDLGVGCSVFAMGLTSALSKYSPTTHDEASVPRKARPLFSWTIAIVVAIGFIRMVVTKGIEYQQHVTEYGVHWNFFFTIASVTLISHIVQRLCSVVPEMAAWPSLVGLGLVIASIYQVFLLQGGLQQFIFDASPRNGTDLVTQNREGIFQLFGFTAIYLIAAGVGRMMNEQLWITTKFVGPSQAQQKSNAARQASLGLLLKFIAFVGAAWLFSSFVSRHGDDANISRRLCNLPYVIWVCGAGIQAVSTPLVFQLLFPIPASKILSAVNCALLFVFLFANILTGLVNVSMKTVMAPDTTALVVLFAYAVVLCGFALAFQRLLKKE